MLSRLVNLPTSLEGDVSMATTEGMEFEGAAATRTLGGGGLRRTK